MHSYPLLDIRLSNLIDLDFDLSRSLKIKCYLAVGLPIYGFLMFDSNMWLCCPFAKKTKATKSE